MNLKRKSVTLKNSQYSLLHSSFHCLCFSNTLLYNPWAFSVEEREFWPSLPINFSIDWFKFIIHVKETNPRAKCGWLRLDWYPDQTLCLSPVYSIVMVKQILSEKKIMTNIVAVEARLSSSHAAGGMHAVWLGWTCNNL